MDRDEIRDEIYVKLTNIFRENIDDDYIKINDNSTAKDIDDWDSLEQINLISRIEKVFNIKFDIKETLTLHNVGEMVSLIRTKI